MGTYKGLKCGLPTCERQALFAMTWRQENERVWGYVCSWHDQDLGKKNLRVAGYPEELVQEINTQVVRGESSVDRRFRLKLWKN